MKIEARILELRRAWATVGDLADAGGEFGAVAAAAADTAEVLRWRLIETAECARYAKNARAGAADVWVERVAEVTGLMRVLAEFAIIAEEK